MSTGSAIEWTEATWNPVTGCDEVSPGCDNCYARTLSKRLRAMGNPRYSNEFEVTLHPDALTLPDRWTKPRVVFVNSMSDLFHAKIPDEFIEKVFETMGRCSRHTFQILTKRPRRVARMAGRLSWAPNIWMGTSIENDDFAWRADYLRNVPAAIRFLSLEPLLGPVPSLDLSGIGWVIIGGESGHAARRMDLAWVRDIQERCQQLRIPVFVKQLGSVWAGRGKGGDPPTWPSELRVRQLPTHAGSIVS